MKGVATVVLTLCIALALCNAARAQEAPAFELYGGYSYLNVDTNGLKNRLNTNGWEISVSGNVTHHVAVEGDVSGYYKTVYVVLHDYSFLGGPRFNFRPFFAHVLVGVDSLGANGASQNGIALLLGGGLEQSVAPHVSIRVSADYAQTDHNIFGGPRVVQDNFRAGAGIVFTFGGPSSRRPAAGRPAPATAAPGPVSERSVLGASGYATDRGFMITAVEAGSPAQQIYLTAGDVIQQIDGRNVSTRRDIDSAIAASANGTVKLDCLIQTSASGLVSVERTLKVR